MKHPDLPSTDAEWHAILTAIGPLPPAVEVDRARLEISECIQDFSKLPVSREKLLAAREEARRAEKLLVELIFSFATLYRWTSGQLLLVDVTTVRRLRKRVRGRIEGYDMLIRANTGKQDSAREWLYWRLLDIWTDALAGKLGTSNPSSGGVPTGPLVRYMTAVLSFALGDEAPGPHAIAKIVRREKKRRPKPKEPSPETPPPKGTLPAAK